MVTWMPWRPPHADSKIHCQIFFCPGCLWCFFQIFACPGFFTIPIVLKLTSSQPNAHTAALPRSFPCLPHEVKNKRVVRGQPAWCVDVLNFPAIIMKWHFLYPLWYLDWKWKVIFLNWITSVYTVKLWNNFLWLEISFHHLSNYSVGLVKMWKELGNQNKRVVEWSDSNPESGCTIKCPYLNNPTLPYTTRW